MLLLAFLFGCADPSPVAKSACEAIPGLATDEVGLKLLEPLLTAEELAALQGAEPTLGLQKLGPEGLAKLRAETKCAIEEVHNAGSGRWAVKLSRTQPEVKGDGTLGDPVTRTFEWQAADEGGSIRIEAGIPRAANLRKSIAEAIAQDDLNRVSATWRSLGETFTDPLLAVDRAAAEAFEAETFARKAVTVKVDRLEDDSLVAKVRNGSKRPVVKVLVGFGFTVAGTLLETKVEAGPLPPAGDTEVRVKVPEGAGNNVKVKIEQVDL